MAAEEEEMQDEAIQCLLHSVCRLISPQVTRRFVTKSTPLYIPNKTCCTRPHRPCINHLECNHTSIRDLHLLSVGRCTLRRALHPKVMLVLQATLILMVCRKGNMEPPPTGRVNGAFQNKMVHLGLVYLILSLMLPIDHIWRDSHFQRTFVIVTCHWQALLLLDLIFVTTIILF